MSSSIRKCRVAAIAGLLLAAPATLAAADNNLVLSFQAAGAPMILPETGGADTSRASDFVVEGEILSAADIVARGRAKTVDGKPKGLFSDARLVVDIRNADGTIGLVHEIGPCRSLDLFSVVEDTFPQKASCDGRLYEYSAGETGIVLIRDKQPASFFDLEAGLYAVNGVPFRVGSGAK
ncbi:hypothetical protein [Ensifer soli]|uniref:hypothetical protein n=1 Tax=Ciceribacter sp. sgz301302 TaxID=3342379 RepID=UPI0035B83FF8